MPWIAPVSNFNSTMAHAEHMTIARPVADVFGFLADATNDPQWRPSGVEMTHVSGTGAGARYRQRIKGPLGRKIPADIEDREVGALENHKRVLEP
jgi:hypothetical protein